MPCCAEGDKLASSSSRCSLPDWVLSYECLQTCLCHSSLVYQACSVCMPHTSYRATLCKAMLHSSHSGTLLPMQVLQVIDNEAVPLLRRCSLSGNADLLTHNALFSQHPLAVDMLIDILTDRGFFVAHVAEEQVSEL